MDYNREDILNLDDREEIECGARFPKKKAVLDWLFLRSPISHVDLPEGYVEIGAGAFSESNISTFKAEYGLEVIGKAAFSECARLSSVIIPKSVKKIGWRAFKGCTSLKELSIEGPLDEWEEQIAKGCVCLAKLTCNEKQKDMASEWVKNCPELKKINFVDDEGKVVESWGVSHIRNVLGSYNSVLKTKESYLEDYSSDFDHEKEYHGKDDFTL